MILERDGYAEKLRMRLFVNSPDPDSGDVVRYHGATHMFYAYSRGVPENLTFDPREKLSEIEIKNVTTGGSMLFKRTEHSIHHGHYLTFSKSNHLGQASYLVKLYLNRERFDDDWERLVS